MPKAQRIMIIRHAEKPYVDNKEKNDGVRMNGVKSEESLTVRGWQRAGAISLLFGSAEIAQTRGFQYLSISTHPTLKKQTKPAVTAVGPNKP